MLLYQLRVISDIAEEAQLATTPIHSYHLLALRFDREGGAQQVAQPLSDAHASGSGRNERRCTLGQIADEGMGTSGQPAFVQVPSLRFQISCSSYRFDAACTGQRATLPGLLLLSVVVSLLDHILIQVQHSKQHVNL